MVKVSSTLYRTTIVVPKGAVTPFKFSSIFIAHEQMAIFPLSHQSPLVFYLLVLLQPQLLIMVLVQELLLKIAQGSLTGSTLRGAIAAVCGTAFLVSFTLPIPSHL